MKQLQFYGTKEFADYLEWDKAKLHTYYKRGKVPDPKGFVGKRPFWTKEQMEQFKKECSNEEEK